MSSPSSTTTGLAADPYNRLLFSFTSNWYDKNILPRIGDLSKHKVEVIEKYPISDDR